MDLDIPHENAISWTTAPPSSSSGHVNHQHTELDPTMVRVCTGQRGSPLVGKVTSGKVGLRPTRCGVKVHTTPLYALLHGSRAPFLICQNNDAGRTVGTLEASASFMG